MDGSVWGRAGHLATQLYVRFKRGVDLPTWGAEHHGQLRYNPATDRMALAGPSDWEDLGFLSDLDSLTDLVLDGTLETSGTNPTIAVESAAGTGGSVGAVVNFGNDIAGRVTITSGSGSVGTGSLCQITFASARPDIDYSVQLTAATSQAAVLRYYVTDRQTTSFDIGVATAPGTGETLSFAYLVIEDA